MKLVDISVISEPVEFIFNLLNVVDTKHFLFSLTKLSNVFQSTLYIYIFIMHMFIAVFRCVYIYYHIYIETQV